MNAMRRVVSIGALSALLLASPDAWAGSWFLTGTVALGGANQEIESPIGRIDFESIGVVSLTGGGGYRFSPDVSGSLEIGWSERGGGFTRTSVFHPDGDGHFELDRSYFDVLSTWSYRMQIGQSTAGVSLAPRISFLLTEPELGFSPLDDNKVIPGIDPSVFVGFKGVRIVARYVLDLGPSYEATGESGTAKVLDSGFFVGLGMELPI